MIKENESFTDLLVNPPENWTWLLEPQEYPICPECSNELECRVKYDLDGIKIFKNVCTICGYESPEFY